MKIFYSLFCFVILASSLQAIAENKNAKVAAFNPINQERWQEFARTNAAIQYFDKQTITTDIQQFNTNNPGIPLTYTIWIKSLLRNGDTTTPQRISLNCQNKEQLIPESVDEKLYETLCLNGNTAQIVQRAVEQKRANELQAQAIQVRQQNEMQQSLQAQQQQQQLQQRNTTVQSTLWQGLGLINSFRRY